MLSQRSDKWSWASISSCNKTENSHHDSRISEFVSKIWIIPTTSFLDYCSVLAAQAGQAQWQSGHLSASLCGREWGHGGHRLIMDVIIWSDPRTPRDYGPQQWPVTIYYVLCLSPLHKCVVWLWGGASVWLDVAWCVTILTIRHIWAGPLIIVSCSMLTYLSSETLDIDSDPVTMISHIIIVPRICSVLFLCLIDLVVIIWIMLRKLNFDHEMPLTLGLNVSNDHLLMISISYHHFYVLFISYTMISYNSDSRAHTRPLALVSRSATIQIKTGLVGKSLD